MRMSHIPFATVDWSTVEATEHPGELVDGVRGMALWRTREFGPADKTRLAPRRKHCDHAAGTL